MTNPADILIRILGDSSGFSKATKQSKDDVRSFTSEVDKAGKSVGAFGNIVQGVFQGIGQAIFRSIGQGVSSAVGEIGKAVKAASDLNETLAKTGAVFDENAQDIVNWSQTTSKALGVSQQAALNASSSLGNMFKQLGFTGGDAATFSKTLVGVSADLVAFHNVAGGTTEVLDAIQSAFRGEYDPIQRYIPIITAAAVQQQALADTGKKSADQLTASEKAAAAYTIILDNLGDAAGAAAREIESAASQQRIFDARLEDAQAQFGQLFVPIQTAFYKGLNELLDQIAPYGPKIIQVLADSLAVGISALVPVMELLHGFFAYWMEPHSPPRFLKDLTKWGQDTLKEYLKGWTEGDFSALEDVGGSIERILRSFAGAGQIKETDLVSRVFGSTRALIEAINEWRNTGTIAVGTLDAIRRSAGPAGDSVGDLVNAYFNLQTAAEGATEAQRQLDEVTRKYDAILSPLDEKLSAVQDKEQEIRDNQRLEELGKVIADRRSDASDRELARLEQEEIQLRRQKGAIEDERDTAVDAEQKKVDAAKKEQDAKQAVLDQAQSLLDQQVKTNSLIQEETELRQRLADEALSAQEKAQRALEAAQREADAQSKQHQAELDRNADAQLRYRLATSDTAGQLKIWQEVLKGTIPGTAEYFDALTQVYLLTQKLNDEIDKTVKKKDEGGKGGILGDLFGGVDVTKLTDAINAVFAAAEGKGKPAVLSGVWKEIADNIASIGDAAMRAVPFIQALIDIVTGKEAEGTDPGSDPFGDNWWLKGLVPTFRTVKADLDTFQKEGWGPLWTKFKNDVINFVNGEDWEKEGPQAFAFYRWIVDTLIPAIDLLAVGDWKDAFTILGAPINALVDNAYTQGKDLIGNFFKGMLDAVVLSGAESWAKILENLHATMPEIFGKPAPPGGRIDKGPGGGSQDVLPPNNNSSFPGVGIPGITPASLSALGGNTSTTSTANHLGPINLVFNVPVTQESARSAAVTVDTELRRRGWAPT